MTFLFQLEKGPGKTSYLDVPRETQAHATRREFGENSLLRFLFLFFTEFKSLEGTVPHLVHIHAARAI